MSWNRIIINIFIIFFLSFTSISAKKLMSMSEDQLIVMGLLSDEYEVYGSSYEVYRTLFNKTQAEVYLFKEASSALLDRSHIVESIDRLKKWDKLHPGRLEVRRLLIPLYLTSKQVQNAKNEAEYLLEQSNLDMDIDLASNSFLYAGEFKRALKLLTRVYELSTKENILLRMTALMDEFTGERQKAIQLLETHRRMNISSNEIYIKLLMLYQKEQNINGILDTYKALYKQENTEEVLNRIIDVYTYKKDIDAAIDFLEKDKSKNILLYELYKSKKYFTKALSLVDSLYNEDKNAKWLAEKAILIFEEAKNKDDIKMIQNVIKYFEKAIERGNDDSIYLNYYGYTLIDKEIDIQKGMDVIENALIQQPDNMYYIDSLAWGHYKQGKCKKAYDMMQKVVKVEGLEEKEIIEHWNIIKQCK